LTTVSDPFENSGNWRDDGHVAVLDYIDERGIPQWFVEHPDHCPKYGEDPGDGMGFVIIGYDCPIGAYESNEAFLSEYTCWDKDYKWLLGPIHPDNEGKLYATSPRSFEWYSHSWVDYWGEADWEIGFRTDKNAEGS